MNKQELAKLLCEHRYITEEKREAKHVANILADEGFSIGYDCTIYENGTCPDGKVHYLAEGSCATSVVAIKKDGECGFDYYIVDVDDGESFSIIDFQEKWLPMIEARCQKEWGFDAVAFDSLLYYLMAVKLDDDQRDNAETVSYVLHECYCLRATIDEETKKYKLEPVHGYSSGMAMDEVIQYGCHFRKPVFVKVECPSCHHAWMFDDSNIPEGEKYELICKKCGMMLMRNKER